MTDNPIPYHHGVNIRLSNINQQFDDYVRCLKNIAGNGISTEEIKTIFKIACEKHPHDMDTVAWLLKGAFTTHEPEYVKKKWKELFKPPSPSSGIDPHEALQRWRILNEVGQRGYWTVKGWRNE